MKTRPRALMFMPFLMALVMSAGAVELGPGPAANYGDPYPYTQTISEAGGSFDVVMDASMDSGSAQLYVSDLFGTIGIMKSATGSAVYDERQINSDEVLDMTITNLIGGSVSFNRLSGTSGYFETGKILYLYKNDVLVNTISCNGNGSYDIFPPIVAMEGDTISFNPSGVVRLAGFEVTLAAGFPADNEPYIPNSAATTNLLNTTISSNGHYYVTADWSDLTHQPDGVVVKVGNGDASTRLYYLGETGPTATVDFDLLVLEPGDTVQVLAGLTGDAGEDPGVWNVSLDRTDSWTGSRYSVPTIPLGLATPPSSLDIHQNLWPKTSGFRNDYRALRGQDVVFDFLAETLGHAPKCFDEELSYPSANIPILDNYVQAFTDRQALFHWNGWSVKPWLNGTLPAKMGQFKPYHFRYNEGTYLTSALTSLAATQCTVENASVFTTDIDNRNIAIIIPVDPVTGKRQLASAELVTVTAISGNQLTVTRNVYQSFLNYTSAGSFAVGSYIAPASQLLNDTGIENGGIRYNLSLLCPVDENGRTGADMLAEMLSYEFAEGSNLERFHGIMFDVLQRSAKSTEDCNLDGIADGGTDARGVDLYHLGVQGMGRKLRAAIPGRIITFDGQDDHWPTLHTVFSGTEAEGFSRYNDSYTKRWSKSPNYYLFTKRWNPSTNLYSFCVTKQNDEPPAEEERPLRRFHEAGLTAMGVAVHHDPIVMSNDGPFYALDEMRKGVENQLQWLGAPVGDLIRSGLSAPDELAGAGLPAAGWSSPDGSATVSASGGDVLVTSVDTGIDHDMIIEFSGISIPEGDLLIRFEGKGGLSHLPSDCARYINVEVDGRVQNDLTYDTLTGVVNNEGFTEVTAYYRSAAPTGGTNVTLRLLIESAEEMTLRNFTIHNATDTLVREFENGIVLCNPSENPHTFDLASLFPGQQFRRIQGQTEDDSVVNDGSDVGSSVQLDGYRGLFLIAAGPSLPGESFTLVNYTPLNGYKATLPPDIDTLHGDTWTFSDTDPMVSDPGTNTVVYGGLITTWSGPETYQPNFRNKGEELQLQINPGDKTYITAKGVYLWPKAEFLAGTGSTLAFAYNDMMSYETGWFSADQRNIRFVVNQGGTYYVSEFLSEGGAVTFYPTSTQWAPLNTNDYSYGSFASLTLDDVQGVGLYMDLNISGSQLAFEVMDFQTTAHAADYYTLWADGYSLTGTNALTTVDIEPDGMNNYMEYALGGNPTNSDASSIMPTFAVTSESGSNWMELVHRRRNDYAVRGIGYTVETSTNLLSGIWTTNGVMESGSAAFDASFDMVTNQVPVDAATQKFIRLLLDASG